MIEKERVKCVAYIDGKISGVTYENRRIYIRKGGKYVRSMRRWFPVNSDGEYQIHLKTL